MQRGKGYCLKLAKKNLNSILSWYCLTRNFILLFRAFSARKGRGVLYRKIYLSVIFSLTNFWATDNRANAHISTTEQRAYHCISEKQLRLNSYFPYAEAAPRHMLFLGVAGSTLQDASSVRGSALPLLTQCRVCWS